MKTFPSQLRVILIISLITIAAEYLIDAGDRYAIIAYPEVSLFLLLIFVVLVAFEVIHGFLNELYENMLTAEQQKIAAEKKLLAKENHWLKRLLRYLVGHKKKSSEEPIIENHNYDGILELDNPLPPWWLYLFYLTILFAGVYLVRYHILDGPTQKKEYEIAVLHAEKAIDAYKKTAVDMVDASTVVMLEDTASLEAGKQIFDTQCAVCHRPDGGGSIGPNLTDDYWVSGGDIQAIFSTVSEGGRPGKGMIPWKATLRPQEIQQVSSYIISLVGSNPENPKAPEGIKTE